MPSKSPLKRTHTIGFSFTLVSISFKLTFLGLSYLLVLVILVAYHHYALIKPKYYQAFLINQLRFLLLVQYYALFMPFYEVFISIFNCKPLHGASVHYLFTDMKCYEGQHITYSILSAFGLLLLISINSVMALLYNETQPVKEDCLSRLESTFELLLFGYRIFVCSFTMLCTSNLCGWFLLFVYLASGVTMSYQYFIYIPYYNQFVSIFFGSIINIYTWIAINCLLTKLIPTSGHVIIILLGIPLIVNIVIYLRKQRIESLMDNTMDKINNDVDALIQINMIKDLSLQRTTSKGGMSALGGIESEMKIKGIINIHFEECKQAQCICKNLEELYDTGGHCYLSPSQELHNEPIFINHYNKKLYEEAIQKFIGSPNLHISFSFYLYSVMKNIHAALHELNIAHKKKPTIQQQFTIFRYKYIYENYVKAEDHKNRFVYEQLTKVKEFEYLLLEMSRAIESVCNSSVEFWSQLTTAIPDLNVLNDLGNKIYSESEKADHFWRQLSHINPNYPAANQQYGEYLSLIRNNPALGKKFIDRSVTSTGAAAHHSDEDLIKKSEILYTEDTTVVHISGNRETSGKILKVSHGVHKCFGYTKQEVLQHNVSFLMPGTIGIRHNEFLEKFYKTGRERVFNIERPVFALNKTGHCFYAKVLVKQMPTLKDGMQYVGMIRPTYTEFDYIITNMYGNIDSFSKGVSSLLGISPQLFRENNSQVNIMLICPELAEVFNERRKIQNQQLQANTPNYEDLSADQQASKENLNLDPDSPFHNHKLAQPGGNPLAIILPHNFAAIARQEKHQKQRGSSKKKHSDNNMEGQAQMGTRSGIFADFIKYIQKSRNYKRNLDIKKTLQCKEYKDHDKLKLVQCELEIQESRINRSELSALKYLVFKIRHPGNKSNKDLQEPDGPGQDNDGENAGSQGLDDEQDQLNMMKNAHPFIQEVFGPKDESGKAGQTPVLGALKHQFQMLLFKNGLLHANKDILTQPSSTPKTGFAYLAELLAIKRAEMAQQAQKKALEESSPNNGQKENQLPDFGGNQSVLQDFQQTSRSPASGIQNLFQRTKQSQNSFLISAQPVVGQIQQTFAAQENVSPQFQDVQTTEPLPQDNKKQLRNTSFHADTDLEDEKSGDNDDSSRSETSSSGSEGDSDLNTFEYHKKKKERKLKKTQQAQATNKSTGAARKLLMNILGAPPLQTQITRVQNTNKDTSPASKSISQSRGNLMFNQIIQGIPVPQKAEEPQQVNNLVNNAAKIEELQETPRIDVKKDIQINDKIKQKTAPFQQEQQKKQLDTIKDASIASSNAESSHTAKRQSTIKKPTQPDGFLDQDVQDDAQTPIAIKFQHSTEDENPVESAGFTPPEPNSRKMGSKDAKDSEDDMESLEEEFEEEIEEIIEEFDEEEEFEEEGAAVGETSRPNAGLPESERHSMQRQPSRGGPQQQHVSNRQNVGSVQFTGVGEIDEEEEEDHGSKRQNHHQGWMNTNYNHHVEPNQPKKKKLRNYDRIVTNPKDTQYDIESCGSVYLKDWELGNDEIAIRETIKKCENRKLKKERRRRKQMRQAESDKSSLTALETGATALEESEDTKKSEEDKDDTQSAANGSADGMNDQEQDQDIKEEEDDISEDDNHRTQLLHNEDQGDVSSVASSMYSQMRSYFTLRESIDEKFVPLSIQNLKAAAFIVFLALLILNIIQFAIQQQLFGQVQSNIQNIHFSEMRINYIIDINLRIQNLRFHNEGLLTNDFRFGLNSSTYSKVQNELLRNSATYLKDSQTSLSLSTASFNEDIRKKINPMNVELDYENQPAAKANQSVGLQKLYFNIWESVIKIQQSVYQLAADPSSILTNSTLARFVHYNCLNSLLGQLKESTQAIILATNSIRDSSLAFFLYLLIAVSCALLISVAFLLPIINRAKKQKQDVLELFLHKKIERAIDDQLKLCRWFISKYQVRQESGGMSGGVAGVEGENGDKEGENASTATGGTEGELKKEKEELYTMKKIKKKKKWKKLNIGFEYLSLKLLLIVAVLETFYIVSYLVSKTFMSEVTSLTSELRFLISRQPLFLLVLFAQKELFYTNGTAQILGNNVRQVLADTHKQLIADEQSLLELFSGNIKYHTGTYNGDFNKFIYGNICENLDTLLGGDQVFLDEMGIESALKLKEECDDFNLGIMQKGLYSVVTKYLSQLKSIDSKFLLLRTANETAKDYINDPKIYKTERTSDIYMRLIHRHLVNVLEKNINTFFDEEYKQDIAIFIVFLLYLLLIYFFVWRIFLANILDELWRAKSMLSILPIDLYFKIEEIRLFIYANSSSSKVK